MKLTVEGWLTVGKSNLYILLVAMLMGLAYMEHNMDTSERTKI